MNPAPGATAFAAISVLMFATGIGIPIMAALNSGLGQQLGSPVAATAALFGGGFLLAALVLAMVGSPPLRLFAAATPYSYAGPIFVVAYILAITWAAPRIGIGNAVFFVLLGQLAAAALIDHFGLFGALRSPVTLRRFAGLMVMAAGVYLARKPR